MDSGTLIREYLLLGLRFDRIEDGYVDSFTGDPALRETVASEPAPDPADLARQADRLWPPSLPAGSSTMRAPTTSAPICARWPVPDGNSPGRPSASSTRSRPISTCRSARASQTGTARRTPASTRRWAGRVRWPSGWRPTARAEEIPPERLEECIHAFSSALRDRVRAEFPLPDSETINYEVVTDKPWSGFNYYLGDYRSTVAVNADLRQQMSNLPRLVAHESYPGHHTEHCRKEAGWWPEHGHAEQTLFLVNTPQCLMAEGLADLALYVAVGRGWGAWAGEIYADVGLRFDGQRAEAVSEATAALADVRQDAALMLHDEHRDVDDVVAFLRRWLLVSDERARQSLRFLSSPLWRAYTSTYVEGYRLLRTWLDDRPAGVSLTERFGRLLDEPLIPSALRAA